MAAVMSRAKQQFLVSMLNHCTPGSLSIIKFLTGGISGLGGGGGGEGGILEQYLGFGEQLSLTKPDPVYRTKNS